MRDFKVRAKPAQSRSRGGNSFGGRSMTNFSDMRAWLDYIPDLLLLLLPFQPLMRDYLTNNILVFIYVLGVFAYYHWKLRLNVQSGLALIAGLTAFYAPILPWFHSCAVASGTNECVTWNGFEFDNSWYGLLAFIGGLLIVAKVILPGRIGLDVPISLEQAALTSGTTVLTLGVLRWFNFPAESSETTSVGADLGIAFLVLGGVTLLLASNYRLLNTLTSSMQEKASDFLEQQQQARAKKRAEQQRVRDQQQELAEEEELDELLDDERVA